VKEFPNCVIAAAVGVSEMSVRRWLLRHRIERPRQILMPSPSEDQIADIRNRLLWRTGDLQPEQYLFADARGRLPDPDKMGRLFGELAVAAGLPRIRFHDLRHSFGSIWADRVPPAVLKAWMGHSSITTTERYIHVTDDTFRVPPKKSV